MSKTPEQEKFDQFYADTMDFGNEEDEEDICDYTGEQCIGNKLFCEECEIFHDNQEEEVSSCSETNKGKETET